MDEQIKTGKTEQGNLSLKDIFYKYIRFLPLFILSVALALLIAYTYLRYANQVYSAGGSMLIKSENNNNRSDKVEDILMGNNRSQNIQSEIEILKCSLVMLQKDGSKIRMFTGRPRFLYRPLRLRIRQELLQ